MLHHFTGWDLALDKLGQILAMLDHLSKTCASTCASTPQPFVHQNSLIRHYLALLATFSSCHTAMGHKAQLSALQQCQHETFWYVIVSANIMQDAETM